MLIANIEAQIEAKQKEIARAESEILKIERIIESLKAQKAKYLEIRGLAAYDLKELQDQLEEMEDN
jgi:chromosome segregation ATPase